MTWFLFIFGAVIAGFVQGLTGFAFALIAMSFWIWVLSPQLAAPLVVFASLWCHIIALSREQKHEMPFSLVFPYLCAGLIGVPLGTYLLHVIDAQSFKIVLGTFLVLWCPMMFFAPEFSYFKKMGKTADACIGFLGGILGGLGGFCGAAPSAWVMLKNLPKAQQRYILRHFNFAIQLFTLIFYLFQGTISKLHIPYLIAIIFAVSIPALLGAQYFYKISEKQFKHTVLGLLFASGVFLIGTVMI